jgi:hypothetical protein
MNNKQEFKVGDKVRVIDNENSCLSIGEVHTVEDIEDNHIHIDSILGGFFKSRFEKVIEPEKGNKKIAIKVGDNKHLRQVVLDVLHSKGFKWYGTAVFSYMMDVHKEKLAFAVNHYDDNDITYAPIDSDVFRNYLKFDAATEFGAFIDAISEPAKTIIKIKNDAGGEYEADFVKNPGYVTFGCAKISNIIFSTLNETLNTKIEPDSKFIEQIKIGRGLFSPGDIERIVEHPDFKS